MSTENDLTGFTSEEEHFFDLDTFEAQLSAELEENLQDLEDLKLAEKNIGNTEYLGHVVMNVVWDQFMGQMAQIGGEEFIQENAGLTLDLSKDAHIQTTKNFSEGNIATHNTKIDYENRYNDWQNNFQRNDDGSVKTKIDRRTGEEKNVLRVKNRKADPTGENYNTNFNARDFIDKGRPEGSKTVHKDHVKAASTIIRDPEANAHLTREEKVRFANSDINLMDLDSRANESKGDSSTSEWLNSERNGQKPSERYPINEAELLERERISDEEYQRIVAEGEKKSIQAGKESRRAEATRIGKKALRVAVMHLLSELIKEVFQKLVQWFRSAEKNVTTFISSVKEAFSSFIHNLKTHLVNVTTSVAQTIISSIVGPLASTITRAITFIKQGYRSLKEAIAYVKNPANQSKSLDIMTMEIGKIVVASVTAMGGIVLGEVVEKGLLVIPAFAVEIPVLGTLANVLGMFTGALVAGIVGAIALNSIDKMLEKQKRTIVSQQGHDKKGEILRKQEIHLNVKEEQLQRNKNDSLSTMHQRHKTASEEMERSVDSIFSWDASAILGDNENQDDDFDDMDKALNDLLS